MAILGVGMGLIASAAWQRRAVVVDAFGRGQLADFQFTGQQLVHPWASRWSAPWCSSGLTSVFATNVEQNPRISAEVSQQVSASRWNPASTLLPPTQIETAATDAGLLTPRLQPRSSTTTSRRSSRHSRPGLLLAAFWRSVRRHDSRTPEHGRVCSRNPELGPDKFSRPMVFRAENQVQKGDTVGICGGCGSQS